MQRDDKHSDDTFGGNWTDEKLTIIEKYLSAYTLALQNLPLRKVYIDAFAGDGMVNIASDDGTNKQIEGSVTRALKIQHPFNDYYFVELNENKARILEKLKTKYPDRNIHPINGDANVEIPKLIQSIDWHLFRGVIFVDPYHTNVNWKTIVSISESKALDFWYLFPVNAVLRLLPNSGKIPEKWINTISNMLGCDSATWFSTLYEKEHYQQLSLFEEDNDEVTYYRKHGADDLQELIKKQLKGLFPFVSDKPAILKNSNNAPLFLLLFAVSNPKPAAWNLAKRIADNILEYDKQHGHHN